MRPVTARGFRDVLPAEAAEREVVSRQFARTASAWGYELVETPIVEDLVSLEAAAGNLDGIAFRLVDSDGRLLALRPDMTVPIARLVASRMGAESGTLRFRYAAEVFREHESLRGQMRGFSQLGVELVGEGGPAADAEVVAVMVEGLASAGIADFTVAVGTVAVLHALVAAAGNDAQWGAAVLEAAHNRNLVGLDELSRAAGDPRVARALRSVPRIRGGADAIVTCREATAGLGCEAALDDLSATWELLVAAGVSDRVVIDFSVMRAFDYYTGLVVEAFAPGLGLPLGGGGRYDGVLGAYDSPLPAAGFALGLERVMIALVEQGVDVEVAPLDALIGGDPAAAIEAAAPLRSAGKRVALSSRSGSELAVEAMRLGALQVIEAGGERS
jgi:ATP phosphoribosyltransferase regulatory subunit